MSNEQIRRRKIERHCAATIRALSGNPEAEFRRERLFIGGRGASLYTPHLAVDVLTHSIDRCRGVADAMACRLVYSDPKLHNRMMPADTIAKLVFDILEQLRTESLVSLGLVGVKRNLDTAFDGWCRQCRGDGISENELGLLIYGVAHIVRSRLNGTMQDQEVEDIIESTRFRLAPIIGSELALLRKTRNDQQTYSELALTIALKISDIARDAEGELTDQQAASARHRLMMPPIDNEDDRYIEGVLVGAGAGVRQGEDGDPGYYIFCKDYDKQVDGEDLYRPEQRATLRNKLDKLVEAQAISVPRLAQRLQRIFAIQSRAGWDYGEEEGYLDGRRLGQIVSNPAYRKVFKQEKHAPYSDTVISFLIDNSGSMKRQRYEAVAVMVDIYSRALELAGIKSEILGFTTGAWTGGESMKAWRDDGSPEYPGRLNDRLHIVYKSAETTWRRGRHSIASMMNPLHFREGLDGEALQWAGERLRNQPQSRKCLVMISDGAPMDSATSNYNDEYFLERHLKHVVKSIEKSPDIELKAIGIALDMEEFFEQALAVDLTGTLGNKEFQTLELLFSR
ncbi:MAG: cobalt chelatase [Gammaproteobacteria bacterium]|nr:cobalt chelatase [Gammaproteobacteria bacterium]